MNEHDIHVEEQPAFATAECQDSNQTNVRTRADVAQELQSDNEDYAFVPPRRTINLRLVCRFQGRGRPLSFDMDDQ